MIKTNGRKVDNAAQKSKQVLRLYFLQKYHTDDSRVFDCCQGSGLVWSEVRKQFAVSSYWGVDLKSKSGRISIDSVKVVKQGVKANVIDVDTYGEPWTHWMELLPHIKEPTTVFLTCGKISISTMSHRVINCVFGKSLRMPPTLTGSLWDYANKVLLSLPLSYGLEIVECMEAVSNNQTRYIGIHIQPRGE